jgi:hypothetical protein
MIVLNWHIKRMKMLYVEGVGLIDKGSPRAGTCKA